MEHRFRRVVRIGFRSFTSDPGPRQSPGEPFQEGVPDVQQSNHDVYEQARHYFVGGVNSPVRAFGAVGGVPRIARRGSGARFEDVEGRSYIDYVLSWGPLLLGHAHPEVVAEVTAAVEAGSSYGMPSTCENRLARALQVFFPEMARMRLVNSGTEATMSALRLARGVTGRDRLLKFEGCYHGHADALLVAAGSGLATFGQPSSPGVSAGAARDTLVVPFNDAEALRRIFEQHPEQIAAVILEVLPCNMGLVVPDPAFLDTLQELCRHHGTLLIADEVLTGLRAARGGAFHRFGVEPDLIAVGKVVGGGFPLAAYGGRAELMAQLSPEGPVYQAGTLSGNPVAATAGAITLEILERDNPFRKLEEQARKLAEGLRSQAGEHGVELNAQAIGSIVGLHFAPKVPRNFDEVRAGRTDLYSRFFWGMLRRGVYLAPSAFEVAFVSTAHNDSILEQTLAASAELFAEGLELQEIPDA